MDFLDPKLKKQRNFRLMLGYILVFLLIVTASLILVFSAYGFDVDRKTGQVIQNGLVYVDSAPDKADIFINGQQKKDQTNAKMSLPEGSYKIDIKKNGYRDWSKTFVLEGGSVERITYPLLIPSSIERRVAFNYGSVSPVIKTQSPDRRWLLVSNDKTYLNYDEYDLNSFNTQTNQPKKGTVSFAADLFSVADGNQSLKVIEWSRDNRNVLVMHRYGKSTEFVMLNRDEPARSVNINKLLGLNPDKVTLSDKKADRWYLYFAKDGVLQRADRNKRVETILNNVLDYATYGSDSVLFAKPSADKGYNDVVLLENEDLYNIKKISKGAFKLNISDYDGDRYMAVGSDGDKNTYVYRDPAKALRDRPELKPAPVSILHAEGKIDALEFSANAQFVMSQSGGKIAVYDADKDDRYVFSLPVKLDKNSEVRWMDGHRLLFETGGKLAMIEFEGLNYQELVSVVPGDSAFFDRDYEILYSMSASDNKPLTYGLFVNHMRLAEDR